MVCSIGLALLCLLGRRYYSMGCWRFVDVGRLLRFVITIVINSLLRLDLLMIACINIFPKSSSDVFWVWFWGVLSLGV